MSGPSARIIRAIGTFETASPKKKTAVFFIISTFIVLKCRWYFNHLLFPKIVSALSATDREQVSALIHFDFLAVVMLALFALFVLVWFAGRPESPRGLFAAAAGHPVWTFVISFPIIWVVLVVVPMLIVYGPGVGGIFHMPLLNSIYTKAVLATSFCLALVFADLAAPGRAIRWWTLPFLIGPGEFSLAFPLLWWSALAGWMPSRLWSFWRPILAAMSLVLPALAFLNAQPIMGAMPAHFIAPTQTVAECIAYGATRVPKKQEIYTRCDENLYHLEKTATRWALRDSYRTDFIWDEGGYDFKNDTAFIHDGMSGCLHILSLGPLEQKRLLQVPLDDFPIRLESIHTRFDPKSNSLILGEDQGALLVLDAVTLEPKAKAYVGDGRGYITRLLVDSEKGELLVMMTHRLASYRIDDLSLVAQKPLDKMAHGIALDQSTNRVYVSYPRALEIEAFDRDTFATVSAGPAPAGARPLVVDEKRRLLFIGSLSGVLEVRDADDYSLKSRVRLSPWIRRLELFKDHGEILVTFGKGYPVIWQYDPADAPFDFLDSIDAVSDRTLRLIMKKVRSSPRFSRYLRGADKADTSKFPDDLFLGGKTALIVDSNPADLEMGAAILRYAHYNALTAANAAQAREVVAGQAGAVDIVIWDETVSLPGAPVIRSGIEKIAPGAAVIQAGRCDKKPGGGCVTKPYKIIGLLWEARMALDNKASNQKP